VRSTGYALKYASKELRSDRRFIVEAVRCNGFALRFASQVDDELVRVGAGEAGVALMMAPESQRRDWCFCKAKIQDNVFSLQFSLCDYSAGDVLVALAEKSSLHRVQFLPQRQLQEGDDVMVSFPGVYGFAWDAIQGMASPQLCTLWGFLGITPPTAPLKTTCVFLPDKSCAGYGQHDRPEGEKRCYCTMPRAEGGLEYGQQPVPWGCAWFTLWKKNVLEAHAKGVVFYVIMKEDGELGNSQQGEVSFLRFMRIKHRKMPISKMLRLVKHFS